MKNVLIICDDISISLGLSYYFRENGYIVDVYHESTKALEYLQYKSPDFILIHYSSMGKSPNMATICNILRENSQTFNLPIAVISKNRDDALLAGASMWFDIIFDIEEVEKWFRSLFQ